MDLGGSEEGITPNRSWMPSLGYQKEKPSKDRKTKGHCSYFFTFFTFMLAVLPQVRSASSPGMSGISAPLACRTGGRNNKELQIWLHATACCLLSPYFYIYLQTQLKRICYKLYFCPLTKEKGTSGLGSRRGSSLPAPCCRTFPILSNNCKCQDFIHCHCWCLKRFSEAGVRHPSLSSILRLPMKHLLFRTLGFRQRHWKKLESSHTGKSS